MITKVKKEAPKKVKKGSKILSKKVQNFLPNLGPFFQKKKKTPAATPPAEKTCFLQIKNLYGKKIPNQNKNLKKGTKN